MKTPLTRTLFLTAVALSLSGCGGSRSAASEDVDLGRDLNTLGLLKSWDKAAALVERMSPTEAVNVRVGEQSLADFAISSCSTPLAKAVVAKGVKLNTKSKFASGSAIHYLVFAGACEPQDQLAFLRFVLDNGLDPNQKEPSGADSPASFVMKAPNDLVMKTDSDFVMKNQHDVALLLLDHGANPNAVSEKGETWLEGAIGQGNDELVLRLWAKGAELKRTKDLARVLDLLFLFSKDPSRKNLRDQLLERLKTEGLKDATDGNGRNLFGFAVANRHLGLANAAISIGSRLDIRDNKNELPASLVMSWALGDESWMHIFRKTAELCSFDPNARRENDKRPILIIALENAMVGEKPEAAALVLETLLKLGADASSPVATANTGTDQSVNIRLFGPDSPNRWYSDPSMGVRWYNGEAMTPLEQAQMAFELASSNANEAQRTRLQMAYGRVSSLLRKALGTKGFRAACK